nr:hypothetical protein Iba_chr10bCG7690 [Ipomoea batatas]
MLTCFLYAAGVTLVRATRCLCLNIMLPRIKKKESNICCAVGYTLEFGEAWRIPGIKEEESRRRRRTRNLVDDRLSSNGSSSLSIFASSRRRPNSSLPNSSSDYRYECVDRARVIVLVSHRHRNSSLLISSANYRSEFVDRVGVSGWCLPISNSSSSAVGLYDRNGVRSLRSIKTCFYQTQVAVLLLLARGQSLRQFVVLLFLLRFLFFHQRKQRTRGRIKGFKEITIEETGVVSSSVVVCCVRFGVVSVEGPVGVVNSSLITFCFGLFAADFFAVRWTRLITLSTSSGVIPKLKLGPSAILALYCSLLAIALSISSKAAMNSGLFQNSSFS